MPVLAFLLHVSRSKLDAEGDVGSVPQSMVMIRTALTVASAVLLAACVTDPFAQHGQDPGAWRQHQPPAATSPAQARSPRSAQGEARGRGGAVATQPGAWQVLADGTVGCADPQALRILRQLRSAEGASPRLLAQAHRDGRCMTVFKVSRWTAESADGEVIKMHLESASPGEQPIALYFLRDEVAQRHTE